MHCRHSLGATHYQRRAQGWDLTTQTALGRVCAMRNRLVFDDRAGKDSFEDCSSDLGVDGSDDLA